ncbi:hypothetical protein [Saccharopolyspora sp. ASAGF58]|uniref:hypothetical protein n=1 Tax=Saccharopolyspora sp. ASAGF58 TaxID=2719023 RepID=UPI0014460E53|nr:hypothetical protein [Saccharopolyspora sp. ASAGF58]
MGSAKLDEPGEPHLALRTGARQLSRHFAVSLREIGDIVRAALMLTHFEHRRLT